VASVDAAVLTLYNANGTTPLSQGSLAPGALRSNGIPTSPGESQVGGGGVTLNTAANSAEYSGYSNYNPLLANYINTSIFNANTLDQTSGYSITFTVKLDSATNNTSNVNPRAAFSIIAISSDNKGIEIGFRAAQIFAQSSANFTSQDAAQTALTDTTSFAKTYKLTIFNDTYALTNGGTSIINGALQNYSFNRLTSSPPLPFNPYTTPSFLFFGDNTGQESGTFTLGSVALDTTPVPFEFSPTYGLLAIGSGLAIKNWRKKAKTKSK
jgi:hypothetical protein